MRDYEINTLADKKQYSLIWCSGHLSLSQSYFAKQLISHSFYWKFLETCLRITSNNNSLENSSKQIILDLSVTNLFTTKQRKPAHQAHLIPHYSTLCSHIITILKLALVGSGKHRMPKGHLIHCLENNNFACQ